MKPELNFCVYCGSGAGHDEAYAHAARLLGRAMAEAGIGLVYGGGAIGLMGTVARGVLDHGGYVTGIIPDFLQAKERVVADAQETIVVPDMHTRKQMMFDRADAFIALPGGIGTLEELVEQLTWAQLGRHTKPILMADVNHFWKPFLVLLAHMREAGFIRPGFEVRYLVSEKIEDAVPMILKALAHSPQAKTSDEALIARF